MKEPKVEFCMGQFKLYIGFLAGLAALVVGWAAWHCPRNQERHLGFNLAAAAVPAPTASPVRVNDKMLHPYWGNCNKCHVTVDPPAAPISKVMAGPPISVKSKMLHDYWGNCLLCHQVMGGLTQRAQGNARAVSPAALNTFSPKTLGLKVQSVTGDMMRQLGLANEDGVLVLEVAPSSIGAQAGIRPGDEILRVGKVRVEEVADLEAALGKLKEGTSVKIVLNRDRKDRTAFLKLAGEPAKDLTTAAVTTPVIQNQIGAIPGQLGVLGSMPQTMQGQGGQPAAANLNYGKVAVSSMGSGLNYPVSSDFGTSPCFVIFDPSQNTYKAVLNPNYTHATGQGILSGQYMVELGVSRVLAGSFDQDAIRMLHTLRITPYAGITGSSENALRSFVAGQLRPMDTSPHRQYNQSNNRYLAPAGGITRTQTIF